MAQEVVSWFICKDIVKVQTVTPSVGAEGVSLNWRTPMLRLVDSLSWP